MFVCCCVSGRTQFFRKGGGKKYVMFIKCEMKEFTKVFHVPDYSRRTFPDRTLRVKILP